MSRAVKVLGGDFIEATGTFSSGAFTLKTKKSDFLGETITGDKLALVEVATEENVKRLGGTVGWGAVGSVLLGPVGLLAGLLLGGKGKDIVFIVKFKDGRKLLASTSSKVYTEIQAELFNQPHNKIRDSSKSPKINNTWKSPTQSPSQTESESNTSKDIDRLIEMNNMLEKGLITLDEFKEFKREIDFKNHSTNNKSTIDEIFKQIEQDGYTFISPIIVKKNDTENTFFVRQDDNKVFLMENGEVIKTYSL